MISKVSIKGNQDSILDIPMQPGAERVMIRNIEGLDPVKAVLSSSNFAKLDGKRQQSSRRDIRVIQLKIGITPDYVTSTVKDIRDLLYTHLMPETNVELTIPMIDGSAYRINGCVESFESSLFSDDPEVDVSITCFQPDFTDVTPTVFSGNSVGTMLETVVDYKGNLETGFFFKMKVPRFVSEFTLFNRSVSTSIDSFTFNIPMGVNDEVQIETTPGKKSVVLIKAGNRSQVLYGLTPQSKWLTLKPGLNALTLYIPGAAVPYSITYTNRYGGL